MANRRTDPALLSAAVAVLRPMFPHLDAERLVAALRAAEAPTPLAVPRPTPGRLLTVREAAARLGVCRATLFGLLRSGTLPRVRLSTSCVRVPEQALLALAEGGAA